MKMKLIRDHRGKLISLGSFVSTYSSWICTDNEIYWINFMTDN